MRSTTKLRLDLGIAPRALVVLLVALFFITSEAGAEPYAACGRDTISGVSYSWCIDDPGEQPTDALYFLHGVGENEKTFMTSPMRKALESRWNETGARRPAIVSLSLGTLWILSDVEKSSGKTAYDNFAELVLPHVEAKLKSQITGRMLAGASMGGFNSSQLLIKSGNRFERVVLLCPMISSVGPQASKKEVEEFIARHQPYISRPKAFAVNQLLKREFPTEAQWAAHNPITLAGGLGARAPEILVAANKQDSFGLHEGAELFAQAAKAGGASTEWLLDTGDHCKFSESTNVRVADFFAESN